MLLLYESFFSNNCLSVDHNPTNISSYVATGLYDILIYNAKTTWLYKTKASVFTCNNFIAKDLILPCTSVGFINQGRNNFTRTSVTHNNCNIVFKSIDFGLNSSNTLFSVIGIEINNCNIINSGCFCLLLQTIKLYFKLLKFLIFLFVYAARYFDLFEMFQALSNFCFCMSILLGTTPLFQLEC